MSKNIIAPLMFVAVLSISGSAFAQVVVNGRTVSASDLPKVQAQCNTLLARSNVRNTDTDREGRRQEGRVANGMDRYTTKSLDLELMTLDDCRKAGLVPLT